MKRKVIEKKSAKYRVAVPPLKELLVVFQETRERQLPSEIKGKRGGIFRLLFALSAHTGNSASSKDY